MQKAQAIPRDALITDQSSLPNGAPILNLHKNEDCFFAESQLVPVANKRDVAENTVTRLKRSSQRLHHNTYAQKEGCRFLFHQCQVFNHATLLSVNIA